MPPVLSKVTCRDHIIQLLFVYLSDSRTSCSVSELSCFREHHTPLSGQNSKAIPSGQQRYEMSCVTRVIFVSPAKHSGT